MHSKEDQDEKYGEVISSLAQIEKLEYYYKIEDLTLLGLMEHETVIEYENAIRSIFDKNLNLRPLNVTDFNSLDEAPFHQIILSTVLNQAVFMREVLMSKRTE